VSSRERPSAPASDAEAITALADQLADGIGSLRKAQLAREAAVPRPARKPAAKAVGPDPTTRPKAAALAKARARKAAEEAPPPTRIAPKQPRLSAAEQLRRRTGILGFAAGMLAGMLVLAVGLWIFTSLGSAPDQPAPEARAEQPLAAPAEAVAALPPVGAAPPEPEAPPEQAPPVVPAAAKPPPAVVASAPPVLVSVNASPWAVIAVDGKPVGETPIADLSLSIGAHEFEATLPDGRVLRRTVDVREGNTHVAFP